MLEWFSVVCFSYLFQAPGIDAGFIRQHLRIEGRVFDAGSFLRQVVVEGCIGVFGKLGNRIEVREAEEAHEEIRHIPDERELGQAAKEYHEDYEAAEDEQVGLRVSLEEGDVDFAVVVVADNGAEGEHEDDDGEEGRCPGAEVQRKGFLGECDAGELAAYRILPGEQDDESGRGADDPGIDVDTEGLYETLLDRMACRCGSRSIRHAAFTGLVGEEAALDACEDGGSDTAADSGLRRERVMEDEREHGRDLVDAGDEYNEGGQQVDASHDGNQELGYLGDARHAAEDDEGCEHAEHECGGHMIEAEGRFNGQGNSVCLYRVVDEAEGDGDEQCEELGDAGLFQGVLDIVGRAAVEGSVTARQLVDLCQGALDEAGRAADEGDDPHPEDGAGAARDDGNRHAGNIADADAGGRAYAKGLKGADLFVRGLAADAFREQAQHFRQHTHLYELRAQREPDADADEYNDEDIRPKNSVYCIDDTV